MNTYRGLRVGRKLTVTKNGVILDPAKSQAVYNHSPDGFNWGYRGSGPAQLALAILLEETDQPRAEALYQRFKDKVIGVLHRDRWQLDTREIAGWLLQAEQDLPPCAVQSTEPVVDIVEDDEEQEDEEG